MSEIIEYEITFHSLWHCGSGESKGADIDNLVIKDHHEFPYIPGKTIKGLTKDALNDLIDAGVTFNSEQIDRLFGKEPDNNACKPAEAFFESAYISNELRSNILKEKLISELYTKVSQTAIDEVTGTAKDKSLRSIEMTIPSSLSGSGSVSTTVHILSSTIFPSGSIWDTSYLAKSARATFLG